jgi:RNA polymerase-interacting CarD/CdnL/TRCF family regulator
MTVFFEKMKMTKKPDTPGAAQARPKIRKLSTRQALSKLRDLLQTRITQFDEQVHDLSAQINESDIRSTNTLVRTLEKVLELENKERKQRSQRARQNRKFDDAERDELARRIANLSPERHSKNRLAAAGHEASANSEPHLDQLGQAETAAA